MVIWPQASSSPVSLGSLFGVPWPESPQQPLARCFSANFGRGCAGKLCLPPQRGELPSTSVPRPRLPHPLGPSACPSLLVSRAPSLSGAATDAKEPAQVGSGRKRCGKPRGPQHAIRSDLSFPVGAEGEWCWPGASSAGGAGVVRPREGAGGLRAQRVLEPAGCPHRRAAADAWARPVRLPALSCAGSGVLEPTMLQAFVLGAGPLR